MLKIKFHHFPFLRLNLNLFANFNSSSIFFQFRIYGFSICIKHIFYVCKAYNCNYRKDWTFSYSFRAPTYIHAHNKTFYFCCFCEWDSFLFKLNHMEALAILFRFDGLANKLTYNGKCLRIFMKIVAIVIIIIITNVCGCACACVLWNCSHT
jgi:hypothetical protein